MPGRNGNADIEMDVDTVGEGERGANGESGISVCALSRASVRSCSRTQAAQPGARDPEGGTGAGREVRHVPLEKGMADHFSILALRAA